MRIGLSLLLILALGLMTTAPLAASGDCTPQNECIEYVEYGDSSGNNTGGACYIETTYRFYSDGSDSVTVVLICI